uniref:Type I-B CRISPR-associated protein Cas5 n=1 Tax=Thermomicrobium roseum TaxID=500 RepID=A0A7C5RTS3_THERO
MSHGALQAIRICLKAYTASFRVPSFVAYQLSLAVPPLSTIFGLLSAAAGRWILPDEVPWLAYCCTYDARARDLETIYGVERKKLEDAPRYAERNIVWREFLVNPELTLFLPPDWWESFRRPRYPLVLGRSQDLAATEEMAEAVLEPVEEGQLFGVLLPVHLIAQNGVTAVLHNLPIAFTADPDRQPVRIEMFGIIDGQRVQRRPMAANIRAAGGWLFRDRATGTIVPLYRREWLLHGDR